MSYIHIYEEPLPDMLDHAFYLINIERGPVSTAWSNERESKSLRSTGSTPGLILGHKHGGAGTYEKRTRAGR